MLTLVKPLLEHKEQYKEMITEWQQYGGPYAPCIIEYDCSNPVNELDYDAVLKVVDDYGKGKVFEYDEDFVKSADFYFLFDNNHLVGMGEIIYPVTDTYESIGQIIIGIRPSKRNKGYATKTVRCLLEKIKENKVRNAMVIHDLSDDSSNKIMKKLNFEYDHSEISEISQQKIKYYTKKLR